MNNPLAKLTQLRQASGDLLPVAVTSKEDIADLDAARKHYRTYIADRIEYGGWKKADVEEYANAVKACIQDPEAGEAARAFWKLNAEAIAAIEAEMRQKQREAANRLHQQHRPRQDIFLSSEA